MDFVWRIAILFVIGAFLFGLGSFPAYAQLVDPGAVGVTFFMGSIFLTAAAYSQFLHAVNPARMNPRWVAASIHPMRVMRAELRDDSIPNEGFVGVRPSSGRTLAARRISAPEARCWVQRKG